MRIQSVGLCIKPHQEQAAKAVRDLQTWLQDRGLQVVLDKEASQFGEGEGLAREDLALKVDCVISLGGDGTLIGVARAVGKRPIPIFGVNLGTLGFLTEFTIDELYPGLEKFLSGELETLPRMRLRVGVMRNDELIADYLALNDVVIAKMALARMIELYVRAGGSDVTSYHADGLIVSTPTGSTGYSISAGGPIVMPGLHAVLLTPICPHTLTQRPVVLPEDLELEIEVDPEGGEVQLTVDGQKGMILGSSDRVLIRRSINDALLVASPYRTRFDVLRQKLRWGQR